MGHIQFHKYQGTGNDFVMIDNRQHKFKPTAEEVKAICDRRFGIGADGLILLETHPDFDFEMNYFNADGSQSFCGNGSRCVVQFAAALGLIESKAHYLAIDGPHHSHINNGIVATQMQAVNHIETIGNDLFINTGSPHYIRFVNDVHSEDLLSIAHQIRYNDRFSKEGTNVNLVSMQQDTIHVRTYERGVEGETLSCGTGVTAVAIAHCHRNGLSGKQKIAVHTQGGLLHVQLNVSENNFSQIELIGPAKKVFEGEWQR